MTFGDAVTGMFAGKYAAHSSYSAGTFLYYDQANKRISKWTGGGGAWNDPNQSAGSGAAYAYTAAEIIDSTSGLPVTTWSFVG